MMKTIALVAALMVSGLAHAENNNWNCNLAFTAKGGGLQVIVGNFKLHGPGVATCTNSAGEVKELPLTITMGGRVLSPSVSFGKMELKGQATMIGVENSPESIFGKYATIGGDATLVGGIGINTGIEFTDAHDQKLSVNVETLTGYGISVGVRVLELQAAK